MQGYFVRLPFYKKVRHPVIARTKSEATPTTFLPRLLIRLYQRWVSPLFPPVCRFTPSCSEYALLSYQRHGLMRGTYLTVRRLARCGPWCAGGYDPVPQKAQRPRHCEGFSPKQPLQCDIKE